MATSHTSYDALIRTSLITFLLSACAPSTENVTQYELSDIDTQTVMAQESLMVRYQVSPQARLSACDAQGLPNGVSVALAADFLSCEISGSPTQVMIDAPIEYSATVNSSAVNKAFVLSVTNRVPDIPTPSDQVFVLGELIEAQEYLSTAGVALTQCLVQNLPNGMTVEVNDTQTGCVLSGAPTQLLGAQSRYFAALNAEGHDVEYFTYEVIRPNSAPALEDAEVLDAIQDNAIDTVKFANPRGGEAITSCVVSPPLPSGLMVNISTDAVSCEISGTPTVLIPATQFTVAATNVFGTDTANITLSVSRDSARLRINEDLIKAFGFSWNSVTRADHYTLYEKRNDAADFSELTTLASGTDTYTKHLTTLFEWPNTEYYVDTCFDAAKNECISSDIKTTSQHLSETIGYFKASTSDIQDQFGAAVALSGDGLTMAVCAPNEESAATGVNGDELDNTVNNSGAVFVFVNAGNNQWTQQAYIKADNVQEDDRFCGLHFYRPRAAVHGLAISDDGNILVVGASGAETVYVFNRTGTVWSQTQKLTAEYADDGDLFGQSVDMNADGTRIVIGAPYEDCDSTGINTCDGSNDSDFNHGAAYLFTLNAMTSTWEQTLYVKSPTGSTGDWFGYAVAMADDGNTFAVSEFFGNILPVVSDELDAGAVYVFDYDTMTETWSADDDYIRADNRSSFARFGTAMDFNADGNRLAIGAFGEDRAYVGVDGLTFQDIEDNNGAGAAYVFDRAAKGSDWSQTVYIKPERINVSKAFGIAIELSDDGEQLFVGASGDLSLGKGLNGSMDTLDDRDMDFTHGSVYHYVYNGGTWAFANYLKGPNHADGHDIAFGYDISISNDTNSIAIGAPGDSSQFTGVSANRNNASNNFAGAVHLY